MGRVMTITPYEDITQDVLDASLIGHTTPDGFVHDIADVRRSITAPDEGILEFCSADSVPESIMPTTIYTPEQMSNEISGNRSHWEDQI